MKWNPVQGEINARCLQVRRAYECVFGERIPGDMPYSEIARLIIRKLGAAEAKDLLEGRSNDPNAMEYPLPEGS